MTNEDKTLLKNALLESTTDEINEVDNTTLSDFSVSSDFKSNIYNSYVKKKFFTPKKFIISIGALIIATIIIFASIALYQMNKKPVFDYEIEISGNTVSLLVSDKLKDMSPSEIELIYSPLNGMLNHGYKLDSHSVDSSTISYKFVNEEKNTTINLEQSTLNGLTIISDQNAEELYKEIYIDNIKLYLFERDTRNVVIWMFEGYEFYLEYNPHFIDEDEVERIINETINSNPMPISEWKSNNKK